MSAASFLTKIAIGGVAGWIIGSYYPAPQSLLNQIEERFGGIVTQNEQDTTDEPAAEDQASATQGTSASTAANGDGPLKQYRAWIKDARKKHPYADSADRMYKVMMCESGGDPNAASKTGIYRGLFQYSQSAWKADWNIYSGESITDPRAQIFATALAWSLNMQTQWGCYNRSN